MSPWLQENDIICCALLAGRRNDEWCFSSQWSYWAGKGKGSISNSKCNQVEIVTLNITLMIWEAAWFCRGGRWFVWPAQISPILRMEYFLYILTTWICANYQHSQGKLVLLAHNCQKWLLKINYVKFTQIILVIFQKRSPCLSWGIKYNFQYFLLAVLNVSFTPNILFFWNWLLYGMK